MKQHNNDNDELPFITLGAATLNVVRYLSGTKDHEPNSERDTPRQRTKEEKAEDERRYIEQRLRDIAAFEERLRSGNTSRRKGN